MAFRSNGPITLALPPFRGVTRQIILATLLVYFGLLVLGLFAGETSALVAGLLSFQPALAYKLVWQFVTYPLVNLGLLSVLFAALSVWFFGATLESELGSRWMGEFFFATTLGGALVALLLSFTLSKGIVGMGPYEIAHGLWPFALSLLLAFARLHPNEEINFNFIFRVKAKYIAAIYLLIYLALALSTHQRFDALVVLTNALCAWLFLLLVPRRGLRSAANEGIYGMRNAWVRARRRRAAKKFSVYMQKQGRDVHFDASGRYLDPDGKPHDPNDRKWMN